MSELGGAIISITLVMMSVFVPVTSWAVPQVRSIANSVDNGHRHRFLRTERLDVESGFVRHLPETA